MNETAYYNYQFHFFFFYISTYEPPLEQFNSTGLTMETFVSKVHVKQPVSVLSLVCEREQTGQLFFFFVFFCRPGGTHTHTLPSAGRV